MKHGAKFTFVFVFYKANTNTFPYLFLFKVWWAIWAFFPLLLVEVCFTATFVSRLKQLKCGFCVALLHITGPEIHSVGVDKRNVEIQRFKRERVLFCFSNLSDKTVKKACQIFSSLVYFCQFSFQFNLEKWEGGMLGFGLLWLLWFFNSPYSFRVTQHSKKGCKI